VPNQEYVYSTKNLTQQYGLVRASIVIISSKRHCVCLALIPMLLFFYYSRHYSIVFVNSLLITVVY